MINEIYKDVYEYKQVLKELQMKFIYTEEDNKILDEQYIRELISIFRDKCDEFIYTREAINYFCPDKIKHLDFVIEKLNSLNYKNCYLDIERDEVIIKLKVDQI